MIVRSNLFDAGTQHCTKHCSKASKHSIATKL